MSANLHAWTRSDKSEMITVRTALNIVSTTGFVSSVTAWIAFAGYGFRPSLVIACAFFFALFVINLIVNKKSKGDELVAHFEEGFPGNRRDHFDDLDGP